jgi:hypothetical protein
LVRWGSRPEAADFVFQILYLAAQALRGAGDLVSQGVLHIPEPPQHVRLTSRPDEHLVLRGQQLSPLRPDLLGDIFEVLLDLHDDVPSEDVNQGLGGHSHKGHVTQSEGLHMRVHRQKNASRTSTWSMVT